MVCQKCGSNHVTVQVAQEQVGATTIRRANSMYRKSGHGCLWWLFIGWWWWIVDLFLWIFFFFPRLILRLFASPYKKRQYEGRSSEVSSTKNQIHYKKIFVCQDCGYSWHEDA